MIRKKGKEFLALMDRWSSLGIEREAIMKEEVFPPPYNNRCRFILYTYEASVLKANTQVGSC